MEPEMRQIFTTCKYFTIVDPPVVIEIPDWADDVFISCNRILTSIGPINVNHLLVDNKLAVDYNICKFLGLNREDNFTLRVVATVKPLPSPTKTITSCAEDALFALKGAELREDEAMELVREIIRRVRK